VGNETELKGEAILRQSQCNWGKSTQTLFCISIKPYFRPRKSCLKNLQNDKEKMVRPWVKVSLCQYQKLNGLREETNRPLSEITREAVSKFVRKKDFPYSVSISYLPKGTRDKYKAVSAYFHRSDWNLLQRISKNTGRAKSQYLAIWFWREIYPVGRFSIQFSTHDSKAPTI